MTDFWQGKQVLVTGAGGFIGSHLVEALLQRGARVRAFVRYTSRRDPGMLRQLCPEDFARLEIVAGDLRDESAVREAVRGCQVVFHLGALISIPYSYLHPQEVASTNVMGTLNVLSACRDLDVGRVVHTSTSEVYGTARRVPIDEGHPLQGQSPYSASKIGADKIAESLPVRLRAAGGHRPAVQHLWPPAVGPGGHPDHHQPGPGPGQHPAGQPRAPRATSPTWPIPSHGFLKAAETPDVEGEVFNLGTGREISIRDLADKIIRMVGRPVDAGPRRAAPAPRRLGGHAPALRQFPGRPQARLAAAVLPGVRAGEDDRVGEGASGFVPGGGV